MKKRIWLLLMPFAAFLLCACGIFIQIAQVPNNIFLTNGSSRELEFHLPFSAKISAETKDVIQFSGTSLKDETYDMDTPLVISTKNSGSTSVTFNLFGLIPVKNIEVTVGDEIFLYPGGQSIGIMLYTDGALIVGSSAVERADGTQLNPAKIAGLRSGDIIKQVDGIDVENADHLSRLINQSSSHIIELAIDRDGSILTHSIEAVQDSEGQYKLGVWVRDSTAGVGTLTFYEPETGTFAGLGHAITDVDTGSILKIKNGEIILSDITEVIKGEEGEPGELHGNFDPQKEVLGTITKNTNYGIYGKSSEALLQNLRDPIPVASSDEVQEGAAVLYCSIDDRGIREYECMIEKPQRRKTQQEKNFVVRITDEELLSKTGGIVQGMSGSPIIQNGKIIGAVTHVLVNDPTRGYGIFIENMLEAAG